MVGASTRLALLPQNGVPAGPSAKSLASTRMKPHIVGMATETKKKPGSRRSDASKQAVLYRGVKIISKTGKRSPIAKVIRDGLRTKSEQSHGETAQA